MNAEAARQKFIAGVDQALGQFGSHMWMSTDQRHFLQAMQQCATKDSATAFFTDVASNFSSLSSEPGSNYSKGEKMSNTVNASPVPMQSLDVPTILKNAEVFLEFVKDKGPIALQAFQLFLTVFAQAPMQQKMEGCSPERQLEHMKTVFCECCDKCKASK